LTEHKTSRQEIEDLLALADRDPNDCLVKRLSEDWRLTIAYNAAFQCATAPLAACGYRAARQAHYYRVIQSLADTIGADAKLVAHLDAFRKKRNISDYERAGLVSEAEVHEMVQLARALRRRVEQWIHSDYPGLRS
jgi:uncharacterized protein (UPF0332 family)